MTRKLRAGKTAAELLIELAKEPNFQTAQKTHEAELEKRVERWRAAERPIVSELRAAGVAVESVWDLVNTADPYPAGLPVLMKHLERGGYPDRVLNGLGRALAVKPAVVYWSRLKALYLARRSSEHQDGLAVALAAVATTTQLDDLIELVREDALGSSRLYLIAAILRVGGDRGHLVIQSLQADPLLGKEARAVAARRTRLPRKRSVT